VSAHVWLAVLGMCGAALALGIPVGKGRRRLATIWQRESRRRMRGSTSPLGTPGSVSLALLADQTRRSMLRLAQRGPSRMGTALVATGAVGLGGLVAAGPIGGLIAGTYAGLAARGLLRRQAAQAAARERADALDSLCALAADLRAGLPPVAAAHVFTDRPTTAVPAGRSASRLAELAQAAWRLAEQTGAPLAELIERIEADARALDRAALTASAQAAGARATAWLLAGLPLGGIALGYGIGVDPLRILLNTPVGALCATGALALQVAGLAWAERLTDGPGRLA